MGHIYLIDLTARQVIFEDIKISRKAILKLSVK